MSEPYVYTVAGAGVIYHECWWQLVSTRGWIPVSDGNSLLCTDHKEIAAPAPGVLTVGAVSLGEGAKGEGKLASSLGGEGRSVSFSHIGGSTGGGVKCFCCSPAGTAALQNSTWRGLCSYRPLPASQHRDSLWRGGGNPGLVKQRKLWVWAEMP